MVIRFALHWLLTFSIVSWSQSTYRMDEVLGPLPTLLSQQHLSNWDVLDGILKQIGTKQPERRPTRPPRISPGLPLK